MKLINLIFPETDLCTLERLMYVSTLIDKSEKYALMDQFVRVIQNECQFVNVKIRNKYLYVTHSIACRNSKTSRKTLTLEETSCISFTKNTQKLKFNNISYN